LITWTLVGLLVLASVNIFSHDAIASPFGFIPGRYLGYMEGSYFRTTTNYDDNGNSVNLPNGNQFTQYRSDFQASYDISRRFGVYGNVGFESVDATTSPVERTTTGFSDVGVGADALLWSGFVNIIPDLSFSMPLYPTPGTDATPLLGDGAYAGTGKLYISRNFKYFAAAVYAGYTYRSQSLSALLPWGFRGEAFLGPFFLDLRFVASTSLNTDYYPTGSVVRQLVTNLYDGGSYIYDTVNPSFMAMEARLGWHVASDLFVTGGVGQTLSGQRSAQVTTFLVGLGLTGLFNRSSIDDDSSGSGDVKDFNVDTQGEDMDFHPDDENEPSTLPRSHQDTKTLPIH